MASQTSIKIDFLNFFKTGIFDYLKLGQTKDWILNNFPTPDGSFDADLQNKGFDIWTYGNIELHFEKQKLFLIYSDDFENFHGGEHLTINPWILSDTATLTLLYVLKKLNEQDIDYKKKTDKLGVLLRLNSGIELTFEYSDEVGTTSNDSYLTSFGLVAENPHRWA